MFKKTVYVMRGESGSGKTPLAIALAGDLVYTADDMPGLYNEDGSYNLNKQSESHQWCFNKFKEAVLAGKGPIAVGNTNMKIVYMEPYIDFALSHGYAVQPVRPEGVLLPGRVWAKPSKKVPLAVIESQRNGYQPMHPPEPGIDPIAVAKACKALKTTPDLIISDLNGTLILPTGKSPFINKADQFTLHAMAVRRLAKIDAPIVILSNQCGVGSGKMPEADLAAICKEFYSEAEEEDFKPDYMAIATHRNSPQYSIYDGSSLGAYKLAEGKADKPHHGLLKLVVEMENINKAQFSVWYVGDAHKTGMSEDYRLVLGAQKDPDFHPEITYIPVEIFGVANSYLKYYRNL